MRVLLLNQVFYPDSAATAQCGWDLARALTAEGHQVTAIASRSRYGAVGATLARRESVEGIEIIRVGRSFFGKKGIAGRGLDFLLFYLAALWAALRLPRHDVVVCFTTPPLVVGVGLLLRLVKGTRCVQWVMDIYPDVAIEFGAVRRGSMFARLLERLANGMTRRADASVVLGRCMLDRMLRKGVPPERLHLIPVWSDDDELRPTPAERNEYRREWALGERFLVMYSGNFGIAHDVSTFIDAAERLRDDDRIRFAFVGGGQRKAELEALVRARGLANCVVGGVQPRERLGELLSAADAHLVSLRNESLGLMVPSKLYGVMGAGRPVLFVGPPQSEVALVIAESRCGVSVATGAGDQLAESIRGLAEDRGRAKAMGERGLVALRERFSRRIGCASWTALLTDVVGRRDGAHRAR